MTAEQNQQPTLLAETSAPPDSPIERRKIISEALVVYCTTYCLPDGKPRDLSEEQINIYERALLEIPLAVLREALMAALRKSRFFPTPADILSQVDRANAAAGQIAVEQMWEDLMQYVKDFYHPDLGLDAQAPKRSAEMDMGLRAAGTLQWLYNCVQDDLMWARKRFIECIKNLREADASKHLISSGQARELLERALAGTGPKQLALRAKLLDERAEPRARAASGPRPLGEITRMTGGGRAVNCQITFCSWQYTQCSEFYAARTDGHMKVIGSRLMQYSETEVLEKLLAAFRRHLRCAHRIDNGVLNAAHDAVVAATEIIQLEDFTPGEEVQTEVDALGPAGVVALDPPEPHSDPSASRAAGDVLPENALTPTATVQDTAPAARVEAGLEPPTGWSGKPTGQPCALFVGGGMDQLARRPSASICATCRFSFEQHSAPVVCADFVDAGAWCLDKPPNTCVRCGRPRDEHKPYEPTNEDVPF